MITWKDKDVSIGAMKFPDKKRPALCITEGSTAQVYGYFNNDECAMLFMQKLAELLGVTKLNKCEAINDDDGESV